MKKIFKCYIVNIGKKRIPKWLNEMNDLLTEDDGMYLENIGLERAKKVIDELIYHYIATGKIRGKVYTKIVIYEFEVNKIHVMQGHRPILIGWFE